MSEILKPCPFCGGTDLRAGGDDKIVGIACLTCQTCGPNHYGRHEWNDRAALSAKDAEIAQLREELASTYEELIDHTGDGMDDARAKRVAELRALQPTSGGEA